MRKAFLTLLAVLALTAAGGRAWAQTTASATAAPASGPSVVNRSGAPVDVDRIIRTLAQKEAEFRTALNNYSFERDATVQTIGMGGQVSGEYRRVSRFVFDDTGRRFEKITFFPVSTLSAISITPEDLEDLGGVQVFALETAKLHEYDFSFVGKERIDDLDLYVFDVTPKVMSDARRIKQIEKSKTPERYFQGRIWVDDKDFQIVKARGKGVPEVGQQRFPTFETYRENIDGRFWFPTYTYADDELVFKSGQVVRVRMRVTYKDFQRLRGKARIIEEGDPGIDAPADGSPVPQPTPAPSPRPKP
ncbi:MAG TPA: hypothetical protein VEY09_06315 [Pyrinomonadaceae bacterium]|nr:hypothetical protein [Pyrinomonadaceae bacterium]